MRKRVISMLLSAVMISSAVPSVIASADEVKVDETVRLDPSNASPFNNGEFEGWGTSMGWWGNRIGYSDAMAQQAAELFYNEEGLGMDIVRYNVGGGDNPTHNHVTRSDSKLPCLAVPEFEEDGTTLKKDENGDVIYSYNWDNDYNQVNVLKEIKKQNDNVHIEGYTNSPPWFMTKSGCSGGGVNAGDENLDPSNYDAFAKFLADVTEHFDEIGLKFDSYSPMNEPNPATKYWTALNNKQEGNLVAVGSNQSGVINTLSNEYDNRGIDTLVVGLDETSIDYSITSYNALTAEAKANLDRLDTHSYGGSNRSGLKQLAVLEDKNLWMSEVDGGWDGFGLAERIILDLNEMQSSAWVLWDIVDFHKDSNFTDPSGNYTEANAYINPDGAMWGMAMGNHDTQEIEISQKYYAYGQFTKYINPGDTLIASSDTTLAAYDRKTGTIKVVALNNSASAKTYTFDMSAFSEVGESAKVIRTSGTFADGEKWASLPDAEVADKMLTYELPAKSITTFVVENNLNADTPVFVNKFEATSTQLSYSYTVSEEFDNCNKYFVIYDAEGRLKLVTLNDNSKAISGDFEGCTFKLFVWDGMKPVVAPVESVSAIPYIFVSGTDMTIAGQDYQYKASTFDSSTVTWSVSDETMATIDQNGLLKPLKSGTVKVTATSETAGSNSMEIYICSAPKIDVTSSMVSGTKSWNDTASTAATMAADGSLTTFFDGLNAGYVVIDLQNEYDIEMIGYAPRAGYEYRMLDGSFYVSNDNATWTEVYKVSEQPASNSLTYVMGNDLKVPEGTYRYVKYAVPSGQQSYNGKSEDYNCNIAEIVIYGTEAELTNAEKVERAIANLEIPETVYGNLNMPTDFGDVKVEWTSSDANVIAADGIVTRGSEDVAVTLTASFSLADVTETKTYTVTVKKQAEGKEEEDMEAYLFVHFVGTEATEDDEQIYFSVSQDGTTWKTLNEGTPVLTSNVGELGVRDPHIIRSPEGDKFFLIATDLSIYGRRGDSNRWGTCQTSGSKSIVIWESTDLTNWSEARLVKVAPDNAGCTWAPESIYDDEKGMYMVFWASKVATDNYGMQRIYRSYTRDFKNFTEPEIYIEDTVSNIDTSFIKEGDTYYRFTKNEHASSIIMEKSTTLDGTFEDVATYTINGAAGNSVTGYEGPTAYKLNGENKWCLLLDLYSQSAGYKPFITDDISTGVFVSGSDFTFDTKYRHGTVMPITQEEYDALVAKYPIDPPAETGDEIFTLDFNNEDAVPALGTATVNGTLTYEDGYKGKAARLNGSTFIDIKGADGNNLLAGLDTFTVSFAAKTDSATNPNWWFYAAPNTTAQTYQSEKYVGVLDQNSTIKCERYNSNAQARPTAATASYTSGNWKHVTIVYNEKSFTLYIDGVKKQTISTKVDLSAMLGSNPVAYIGKANWGGGEFGTGLIDEFRVFNYAMGADEVADKYAGRNYGILTDITKDESENYTAKVITMQDKEVSYAVDAGNVTAYTSLLSSYSDGSADYTQDGKTKLDLYPQQMIEYTVDSATNKITIADNKTLTGDALTGTYDSVAVRIGESEISTAAPIIVVQADGIVLSATKDNLVDGCVYEGFGFVKSETEDAYRFVILTDDQIDDIDSETQLAIFLESGIVTYGEETWETMTVAENSQEKTYQIDKNSSIDVSEFKNGDVLVFSTNTNTGYMNEVVKIFNQNAMNSLDNAESFADWRDNLGFQNNVLAGDLATLLSDDKANVDVIFGVAINETDDSIVIAEIQSDENGYYINTNDNSRNVVVSSDTEVHTYNFDFSDKLGRVRLDETLVATPVINSAYLDGDSSNGKYYISHDDVKDSVVFSIARTLGENEAQEIYQIVAK